MIRHKLVKTKPGFTNRVEGSVEPLVIFQLASGVLNDVSPQVVVPHLVIAARLRSEPVLNKLKRELTTICLQRPPFWGLSNINLPLNNDHLTSATTILESFKHNHIFEQ
jgi:hypothetical protein